MTQETPHEMLGWLGGVIFSGVRSYVAIFCADSVSEKTANFCTRIVREIRQFMAFRIVGFRRRSRLDMEGTSVGEERAIEG